VEKNLERKILDALRKATIGLTIADLASLLKSSRLTIMRYLQNLKGRGLVMDKQVGAYKLWILKENIETKRKLISRKLACILAGVFINIFGDRTSDIALSVGRELARLYLLKYPEDYKLLEEVGKDEFEKIATAIEFITEEQKVEGFSIDKNRGIVRLRGLLCDDKDASEILIILIIGAIIGYLQYRTKKEVEILSKKITEKENEIEVVLEIGIK